MTVQETIDQNIRTLLGDLQLQLVFANARIVDLERQLTEARTPAEPPIAVQQKPNGKQQPTAPA